MKILWPLAFLFLVSCGTTKKKDDKEDEKKKEPENKVIGRIASVSPHSGFVLIQKFGPGRLPDKGIYQSIGEDGRTSSLRPSGERVRDFFAADIINGDVKAGDAVLHRMMTQETPAETSEEEPAKPESPETPKAPKE